MGGERGLIVTEFSCLGGGPSGEAPSVRAEVKTAGKILPIIPHNQLGIGCFSYKLLK